MAVCRTISVVGVAGSVAVGSPPWRAFCARSRAGEPSGSISSPDGFLYPNKMLEEQVMQRKGFRLRHQSAAPLSLDVRQVLPRVEAPVCSHFTCDILPGGRSPSTSRTFLSLRGSMCAAKASRATSRSPSSRIFDFSIFQTPMKSDPPLVYRAFPEPSPHILQGPGSLFPPLFKLTERGSKTGRSGLPNLANLHKNILPTRQRRPHHARATITTAAYLRKL